MCSDVIKEAKKIFPKGNYEIFYSSNSREKRLGNISLM